MKHRYDKEPGQLETDGVIGAENIDRYTTVFLASSNVHSSAVPRWWATEWLDVWPDMSLNTFCIQTRFGAVCPKSNTQLHTLT